MKHDHRLRIMVLLVTCLPLAACRRATEATQDEEKGPARVEHLAGAEPTRLTLTEEAARRLDIQTAPVQGVELNGTQQRIIPYAAVLYDTQGATWTYTNSEPLVFVRHPIMVDHIEGDRAVLSDGPASGIAVVTVGAQELYGAELEFEEE